MNSQRGHNFSGTQELQMNNDNLTRRQFVRTASAASLVAAASTSIPAYGNVSTNAGKLAILGGEPVRKNKKWPQWPYCDDNVVK